MNLTTTVDGVVVTVTDTEVRYEAGAEIDADGAPTAYAPPGSGLVGLDNIRNALHVTNDPLDFDSDGKLIPPPHGWASVLTDENGDLILQLEGQSKGYCIPTTSLQDETLPIDDIRRYVPADTVAYIVIPPALEQLGVRLGDGALVCERDTGMSIQAIVADIGPRRKLGEVSIKCANGCGFNSSPRNGGISHGVIVRIFLNSAADPRWDHRRTQENVAALVDAFASES